MEIGKNINNCYIDTYKNKFYSLRAGTTVKLTDLLAKLAAQNIDLNADNSNGSASAVVGADGSVQGSISDGLGRGVISGQLNPNSNCAGFFDAYHPKSSNLAGRFRAGTKPQYFLNNDKLFASHFEIPTDKIGYFDCIEFGRKAEYPFPEIQNDYDLNIQSQRDKSKIPLIEKSMQIAIKASI